VEKKESGCSRSLAAIIKKKKGGRKLHLYGGEEKDLSRTVEGRTATGYDYPEGERDLHDRPF